MWSTGTKLVLKKMGKLAFNMLRRNSNVFFEEDMMECDLNLLEATVFSGLCTELPAAPSRGQRKFCYVHFTLQVKQHRPSNGIHDIVIGVGLSNITCAMTCAFLQEFMAALYVFIVFCSESKNALDSGSWQIPNIFTPKAQTKSVLSLVQSAVELTLSTPLGHYDMFLRFLCGLLSPDCHDKLLGGLLFPHDAAKVSGLDEVQQLLVQTIQTAQQNNPERLENLEECLREMTQVDEWADWRKPVSMI